jgi:hypothetical protein
MDSFEHGLGNKALLMNQKTTKFGFFYFKPMHFLEMLGEQPFCSICNGTCANFAHPF